MDHRRISLLAHNIRSLWNVGSLFRTADAFAIEKIYLTGYTATPPRREISKTALGAEMWVPWEQSADPQGIIARAKRDGYRVVALEMTADAMTLEDFEAPSKILLIIGHEVTGVPEELLTASDVIVAIEMHRKKESLNVASAAAIALYHLRNCE